MFNHSYKVVFIYITHTETQHKHQFGISNRVYWRLMIPYRFLFLFNFIKLKIKFKPIPIGLFFEKYF